MKRSSKEVQKPLPEGFGTTKRIKTQTQNKKDRKVIKLLAGQAIKLINENFDAQIRPTCVQVIQDYYMRNKTPKACIGFGFSIS